MSDILERAKDADLDLLAITDWGKTKDLFGELIAEVGRLRSFEEFSKKLITLWIYMADAEEVLQNHRMRILEISQNMIDEQSSKIAAKDARIKEMGAEITAWVADRDSWIARYEAVRKEKDARIADQEAYIERLEADFLASEIKRLDTPDQNHTWYPEDESYVDFVKRVKREAEHKAREALERIRNGDLCPKHFTERMRERIKEGGKDESQ